MHGQCSVGVVRVVAGPRPFNLSKPYGNNIIFFSHLETDTKYMLIFHLFI